MPLRSRPPRRGSPPRTEGEKAGRITATEMVGVPLTTDEVRRLQAAVADGKLGPPESPENLVLHKKLLVMMEVALAAERRRAALTPR